MLINVIWKKYKKGANKIKNEIEKSYNIHIEKIYKKDENIYFFVGNKKIYIEELNDKQLKEIKNLVMASNELYENRKNTRLILKCTNDEYYFKHKEKKYILSYANFIENTGVIIDDINLLKVDNSRYESLKINILDNWKKSIDEIEAALVEYNKECNKLMKSINYYIGISENAIQLYISKSEEIKKSSNYLGHYIKDYSISKYLSPLNIRKINLGILFGKYVKNKLYNGTFTYKIINVIKSLLKNDADKYVLIASVMFQEEFFEEVKKMIVNGKEEINERIVEKYTNKINDLESILRCIEDEIVHERIINWLEE